MKTMKKLLSSVAAVFMLLGCQEEQFGGWDNQGNYRAAVEIFGMGTKTALCEGRSVVWSAEDQIAVFEGNVNAGKVYQVLESYVGKSSGEFSYVNDFVADGPETLFDGAVAVYPFNENLSVTPLEDSTYEIYGVSFPSEQKYHEGSFSDEAFPMVAVTSDKNLSFKNIGGVLKLSLTGDYSVSSITLTGNSEEPLAGLASVAIGPNSLPIVHMFEDASTSVTLVCDPAVQLNEETATDFYISIPPTDFEEGFTVKVTDDAERISDNETSKSNTVSRSGILNMPELWLDFTDTPDTDYLWVDLGLSVLWASHNVGANSPEEYGGYYAWGETTEKSFYSLETYEHKEKVYQETYPDEWYWKEKFIGEEISGTYYDVASVLWRGGARMPTRAEAKELVDNCSVEGGEYNGVAGNYLTGPNGNSIFIPYSGQIVHDYLYDVGKWYVLWTGTYVGDGNHYSAYALAGTYGRAFEGGDGRIEGMGVRPVKAK